MKALFKVLFSLALLLALLAVVAYFVLRIGATQAFTTSAAVPSFEKAGIDDLKRIKSIVITLSQSSDWRDNKPKYIELNERDINLAIAQFAPHQVDLPKNSFAKVTLNENSGEVHVSAPVDEIITPAYVANQQQLTRWQQTIASHFMALIEGRWINLSAPASISGSGEDIAIKPGPLSIGNITLSQSLSDQIYSRVLNEAQGQAAYRQAVASWKNIKSLEISDALLKTSFVVPNSGGLPINDYQALVLGQDEVKLIAIYTDALSDMPKRGKLITIIARLFELAHQRSTQSANPVAENRAALLALSKVYGGDQLVALVGQQDPTAALRLPKPYTLYKRLDLAQHLILSSGASLLADENIAELIGVDKELNDLMGGSRISAWDLLADKAGIRLATLATRNAKSARDLQQRLRLARSDRDLLPDLGPDFSGSKDRFDASALEELNEMVSLYLSQHPLYD